MEDLPFPIELWGDIVRHLNALQIQRIALTSHRWQESIWPFVTRIPSLLHCLGKHAARNFKTVKTRVVDLNRVPTDDQILASLVTKYRLTNLTDLKLDSKYFFFNNEIVEALFKLSRLEKLSIEPASSISAPLFCDYIKEHGPRLVKLRLRGFLPDPPIQSEAFLALTRLESLTLHYQHDLFDMMTPDSFPAMKKLFLPAPDLLSQLVSNKEWKMAAEYILQHSPRHLGISVGLKLEVEVEDGWDTNWEPLDTTLLVHAVLSRDFEVIKYVTSLPGSNPNLKFRSEAVHSPLTAVAGLGELPLIHELLAHGANLLEIAEDREHSPLCLLMRGLTIEELEDLLTTHLEIALSRNSYVPPKYQLSKVLPHGSALLYLLSDYGISSETQLWAIDHASLLHSSVTDVSDETNLSAFYYAQSSEIVQRLCAAGAPVPAGSPCLFSHYLASNASLIDSLHLLGLHINNLPMPLANTHDMRLLVTAVVEGLIVSPQYVDWVALHCTLADIAYSIHPRSVMANTRARATAKLLRAREGQLNSPLLRRWTSAGSDPAELIKLFKTSTSLWAQSGPVWSSVLELRKTFDQLVETEQSFG